MKKWCKIIEHNERQYLFTNMVATDEDNAVMKLQVNWDGLIIDLKVVGKDDLEEFTEKQFDDFTTVERVKSFEKSIIDLYTGNYD